MKKASDHRDKVELPDAIRALLAQMIPNAAHIVSFAPSRSKLEIGYIDSNGVHEVVTWSPLSWTRID
jgi:hypothetical protein